MPTPTYDLIEEKVLGSAQASVTFSSIPGTYKDLVLEIIGKTVTTDSNFRVQFNSDTGTNYSVTEVYGSGTAAFSGRGTNATGMQIGWTTTGTDSVVIASIQSYANTNVHKSVIGRYNASSAYVSAYAGLWRSTAAITSATIYMQSGNNIAAGATFRLWGVAG